MEKLDRLGWATGISFRCHGARLGIRCNLPVLPERLWELLPPGSRPARSPYVDQLYSLRLGSVGSQPGVRQYHLLYSGISKLVRTMEVESVWEAVRAELQQAVAVSARGCVFVHASVVGWQGRAIVIPGQSQAGKTTLARELLRLGATYYSDEYAVLDEQGRVHPFPIPLSLRQEEAESQRVAAEALGARTGRRPLPVGLVAVTQFREAARWRARRLPPSVAVLELLQHTVAARFQPQASLQTLSRVAAQAAALKGTRGEAAETAPALLAALQRGGANA